MHTHFFSPPAKGETQSVVESLLLLCVCVCVGPSHAFHAPITLLLAAARREGAELQTGGALWYKGQQATERGGFSVLPRRRVPCHHRATKTRTIGRVMRASREIVAALVRKKVGRRSKEVAESECVCMSPTLMVQSNHFLEGGRPPGKVEHCPPPALRPNGYPP